MNKIFKKEFEYFKSILQHLLDWKFWVIIIINIVIYFVIVGAVATIVRFYQ